MLPLTISPRRAATENLSTERRSARRGMMFRNGSRTRLFCRSLTERRTPVAIIRLRIFMFRTARQSILGTVDVPHLGRAEVARVESAGGEKGF